MSPNDAKKNKVVGPKMKGPSNNSIPNSSQADDILGLDLMGTGSTQQNQNDNAMDLLAEGPSKPQQSQPKNVSYDDLLSGMGGFNEDSII